MRRFLGLVTAALLVMALTTTSAWAGEGDTGYDDAEVEGVTLEQEEKQISFGDDEVDGVTEPGTLLTFEQDGFAPLSTSVLSIASQERTLGFFKADEEGVVAGSVVLPEDMEHGDHTLILRGEDPNGEPLEFRLPIEVGIPSSGGINAVIAGVGGVVAALVILGFVLWFVNRRGRVEEHAEESATSTR